MRSWPALRRHREKKSDKAASKGDAEEIPAPREETFTTGDGLQLHVTYYPGTKGKESIPVVLLHGYQGSRKDYSELAPYLQEKLGCAVLVPDLRGHGQSTSFVAGGRGPNIKPLEPSKLTPTDFAQMIAQDMLVLKNFLWERNNKGELNIDKTCVVGADMGASVALDYALFDLMGYEQNTPAYGPLKLGCFIKALVLISPPLAFKGLKTEQALASPYIRGTTHGSPIHVMILVGKNATKPMADAKSIHQRFEKSRGPAEKDQQTLFFGRLDTKLQGTKMLEEKTLGVPRTIGQFIYLRLVKSPEAKNWTWKERKRPHE